MCALKAERAPANSAEEVSAHRGDSGKFAGIPWPVDLGHGGFIFGYVHFDGTSRLSKVLADSEVRVVDTSASDGAGHRAVLVESRGKFGRHRVWFDPGAGYLPRRVEVEKTGSDVFGTNTVAKLGPHGFPDSFWPDLSVDRVLIAITDVDIRRIENAFAIVGFTYTLTRRHAGGVSASERTIIRVDDLDLNPPYDPSDFQVTVPIPNGTNVYMHGVPQIVYEWRDGEVVKSADQSAVHTLMGHKFAGSASPGWGTALFAAATIVGAVLLTSRFGAAVRR